MRFCGNSGCRWSRRDALAGTATRSRVAPLKAMSAPVAAANSAMVMANTGLASVGPNPSGAMTSAPIGRVPFTVNT